MSRKILMAATGAAALFVTAPAFAQTSSDNINVSLKVAATCTINGTTVGISSVTFPDVQVAGSLKADIDGQTAAGASGRFNVICNTASGVPMFAIGPGTNDSSGVRRMRNTSSGQFIPYRLYSNPARTSGFEFTPDNTKRAVNGGAAVVPNVDFDVIIYGQIRAADVPNLDSGDSNDTVTGTLSF